MPTEVGVSGGEVSREGEYSFSACAQFGGLEYSRSPEVGNPIASILKSNV